MVELVIKEVAEIIGYFVKAIDIASTLGFPHGAAKCPMCDSLVGLPLIMTDIFRVTPCPKCGLTLVFEEEKGGWVAKKVQVKDVLSKKYQTERNKRYSLRS